MSEAEIGDNSMIGVDQEHLEGYLTELADKKKAVSEKNGALRSRIGEIISETGWNKSAFGQIRALDAMSETARADYLRTFKPMFDSMMANVWEAEMRDMIDDMGGD